MVWSTFSKVFSLIALLGFSSALHAQGAKNPTLGEILQRLEANLDRYDAAVPSFFCDEHAISSRVQRITPDRNTVTDSVFRLKRTLQPDRTTSLEELREIKSVNGRPATSQQMEGPALASGIFEGGLAVVSLSQTACMNYTLEKIDRNHPAKPYVVRFATVVTPENSGDCVLQEESKGRVFIDPASMQVTRLEITTPHHTIVDEDASASPIVGRRELTVDYTPVPLGGENFWLPSEINMRNTSDSGTFHLIVWTFRATYRNYHRLEVKSRILDGPE
jgi:hypothetical protein